MSVVDDDPLVLMDTVAMIEDFASEPIEASSGRKALEILENRVGIDVVLTDQAMPGMTGIQLATAIRLQRPEPPLVLATGYAEVPDAATDIIAARLNKPFLQSELAAVLDKVIKEAALRRAMG